MAEIIRVGQRDAKVTTFELGGEHITTARAFLYNLGETLVLDKAGFPITTTYYFSDPITRIEISGSQEQVETALRILQESDQ